METKNKTSAMIVYLSPHGTTRKAVTVLAESLAENGVTTDIRCLNECRDKDAIDELNAAIASFSLVVFGAPTYFHHAPPVFMKFIRHIPGAADGQAAAILSTFGGVSSGVVQFDLARILFEKKYRLIGGIQVLTEHCLTFQHEIPFYAGHPDETDTAVIRRFGAELVERLQDNGRPAFTPEAFRDKPPVLNFIDEYINKLQTFAWTMPGVKVSRDTCTACGLCVKNCPTHNIRLEEIAVHGKNCTYCYSCVRHCPAGAGRAFLAPAAAMPRYFARIFAGSEEQITRQVV